MPGARGQIAPTFVSPTELLWGLFLIYGERIFFEKIQRLFYNRKKEGVCGKKNPTGVKYVGQDRSLTDEKHRHEKEAFAEGQRGAPYGNLGHSSADAARSEAG